MCAWRPNRPEIAWGTCTRGCARIGGSLSVRAVGMDSFGQRPNDVRGLGIRSDPVCGTAVGVQDRGVVAAAEGAADGREAGIGVLAREIHGELARPGDAGRPALGEKLL